MEYDYPHIAREMADLVEKRITPILGTFKAQETEEKSQTKYIDRVAEDAVIQYLKENHIKCQLVTEESGVLGEGDLLIILDPLDGTVNALSGIPFYSVSLAFWGERKYGFVRNLCTRDGYEAFENGIPLKNGKQIYPDCQQSVGSAYFGKGFQKVFPFINTWRCFGSLALELCYVAEGNLKALVDLREKARIVDIAGAQIIAEASGVKVTNEKGESSFFEGFLTEEGDFKGESLVCALPALHRMMLDALQ